MKKESNDRERKEVFELSKNLYNLFKAAVNTWIGSYHNEKCLRRLNFKLWSRHLPRQAITIFVRSNERVLVVLLEDDVVLPPVRRGHLHDLLLRRLLRGRVARGEVGTEDALLLQETLLEVQKATVLVLAETVPAEGETEGY